MLVRKKPGDDGHLRLVRDVCLEGDRLALKRASHLFGRGPVYVRAGDGGPGLGHRLGVGPSYAAPCPP